MEENCKRKEQMNLKGFIVYVCRWSIETCKEWKELDEWMNEWADHRPSRPELIAEIVCFPGDIRKLTTHFLILTPKRCVILNTTKSNSGNTLNGNLIWCFFFCAVIHFTRVLWIRMWGQPSELAPIMMGCDTEIRKKAFSKVYDVWIAGLLKMKCKHGHCTKINIMFLYSDCKLVAPWMSQCWMCQIWRPCSNAFPFSHFWKNE